MSNCMTIWASRGDRVSFIFPNNGTHHDVLQCEKHLGQDHIYTVNDVRVFSGHSEVELAEIPGQWFNTVMFADHAIDRIREKLTSELWYTTRQLCDKEPTNNELLENYLARKTGIRD